MSAVRAVTFTPLVLDGVGAPAVNTGYYLIRPTTAYRDGAGRVATLPLQVVVDGVAVTVDLPVTGPEWALKVVGTFIAITGETYATTEYVTVPTGSGGLDFEDLPRVDPATIWPVVVVTSAVEARIQALEDWGMVVVVQSGGAYPMPLPTGYGAIEFRGSVDPASQFTLVDNYRYKWVQLP